MGKQEPLELLPGTLDMLILKALARGKMHGYGIAQMLKATSEDVLEVGESSLYPALQRMLREGLLESEEGVSAKGRPTRIYRVTNSGIRHLEKELSSFGRMFDGITRVLAFSQS